MTYQWKSMKINENQSNSMEFDDMSVKIYEIHDMLMKINEHSMKIMKFNEIPWHFNVISMKINVKARKFDASPWNSMPFQCESMKINENNKFTDNQ